MTIAYLDTSAFVKLVITEPESHDLISHLADWPQQSSSALLKTESMRVFRAAGKGVEEARDAMQGVDLIAIVETVLDDAGVVDPPSLRTLDAIHLATARALGDDLGVFVTYDARLAEAANALGIPTAAPGSKR